MTTGPLISAKVL